MPIHRSIRIATIFAITAMAFCFACHHATAQATDADDAATTIEIKVKLQNVRDVQLQKNDEGELRYRVAWGDGREEDLSPNEFAAIIYEDRTGQPWWKLFLNITEPFALIWVGIGLLGQILFTGRMIVQWLASEKEKKSVVPVAFWWMSLTGATMLIIYFIWRQDAIGVLGQATGWLIYVRNLWMIIRDKRQLTLGEVVDGE